MPIYRRAAEFPHFLLSPPEFLQLLSPNRTPSPNMTDYYDNYFFTSSLTSNQCPALALDCSPLNACARDPNTGSTYCCDSNNNQCWRGSTDCATDGSTSACGSGDNSWCCLSKTFVFAQAQSKSSSTDH
jgi:hypothetical protein